MPLATSKPELLPPILQPLLDPKRRAALPVGSDDASLAAIGLLGHLVTRCGGHARSLENTLRYLHGVSHEKRDDTAQYIEYLKNNVVDRPALRESFRPGPAHSTGSQR